MKRIVLICSLTTAMCNAEITILPPTESIGGAIGKGFAEGISRATDAYVIRREQQRQYENRMEEIEAEHQARMKEIQALNHDPDLWIYDKNGNLAVNEAIFNKNENLNDEDEE